MIVSIGIDYGRSRALHKAARKFGSQALEADGLHFKIDMFSSAIVIANVSKQNLCSRQTLPDYTKSVPTFRYKFHEGGGTPSIGRG